MKVTKRLFFLTVLLSVCFGISFRHYAPKMIREAARIRASATKLTAGVPIKFLDASHDKERSTTEEYWGEHTVNSIPHKTAEASLEYLDWRSRHYPLFHELMNHYGNHDDEVVLDYGCGPGNDVVGFLAHTNAEKIIGMDISKKALTLASHRLSLHHNFDLNRVELIQVDDKVPTIPLPDGSVDFIYSEGVLHHTSHPGDIIKEFYRVLKPTGKIAIMVYNANSLWKHLYVAYDRQILNGQFSTMSIDEAFSRSTDGEECPIAHNYTPAQFSEICEQAGFQTTFTGGFFSALELDLYTSLLDQALKEERLPSESRNFLEALKSDAAILPIRENMRE